MLIFGCAPSKYIEPSNDNATASVSFERESKSGILGSLTVFVSIDDSFSPCTGRGFRDQQRIAVLDKGNPIVKSDEKTTFRFLPQNDFRLLIRNSSGLSTCDVVLAFRTQKGKEYRVLAKEGSQSNVYSCSAEVFEFGGDSIENVNLNEYHQC